MRDAMKGQPTIQFTKPPNELVVGKKVRIPNVDLQVGRAAPTSALKAAGFTVDVDDRADRLDLPGRHRRQDRPGRLDQQGQPGLDLRQQRQAPAGARRPGGAGPGDGGGGRPGRWRRPRRLTRPRRSLTAIDGPGRS